MDVRALETEQLVASFKGRLSEQDCSAPIALTDDIPLVLDRKVRKPRFQLRLALNHRLPHPALPCRPTPRSGRLRMARDARRRGNVGQEDGEGRGIGASGARVRRVRRVHSLTRARAGLVRAGRERRAEVLPVRQVRRAADPRRPCRGSRLSSALLTAVSWRLGAGALNARDSDTPASKNTRLPRARARGWLLSASAGLRKGALPSLFGGQTVRPEAIRPPGPGTTPATGGRPTPGTGPPLRAAAGRHQSGHGARIVRT